MLYDEVNGVDIKVNHYASTVRNIVDFIISADGIKNRVGVFACKNFTLPLSELYKLYCRKVEDIKYNSFRTYVFQTNVKMLKKIGEDDFYNLFENKENTDEIILTRLDLNVKIGNDKTQTMNDIILSEVSESIRGYTENEYELAECEEEINFLKHYTKQNLPILKDIFNLDMKKLQYLKELLNTTEFGASRVDNRLLGKKCDLISRLTTAEAFDVTDILNSRLEENTNRVALTDTHITTPLYEKCHNTFYDMYDIFTRLLNLYREDENDTMEIATTEQTDGVREETVKYFEGIIGLRKKKVEQILQSLNREEINYLIKILQLTDYNSTQANNDGEILICEYLNTNTIPYIINKRFTFDYKVLHLPFGISLNGENLLIEYDTKEHLVKTEREATQFKIYAEQDNRKNQFCVENNMKLLRIPYIFDTEKNKQQIIGFVEHFLNTKQIPKEIIEIYEKYDFSNYSQSAQEMNEVNE